MELKGKKINFLGDSITFGAGASSPDKCFVSLMKEYNDLAEARNYGIGGTRIARQREITNPDVDNDFNMRWDKMDPDADIIIVFGGTNDYAHGQAPLGTKEDTDVYTFYGAVHHLCYMLTKTYPDKQIVFITPMHRFNEFGEGTWKPEGVEQRPLKEYVYAIKEVCERFSVPVADMYGQGLMHGNIPSWCKIYMPDGLHPNDKGYELLARRLSSLLKSL